MGMFDYIKFKPPLPVAIPEGMPDWQTKDTPAQYMFTYEVTKKGELWELGWPVEDHRSRRIDFHGDICFYESHPVTKEWFVFLARFTDGKFSHVRRVIDAPTMMMIL